MKEISDLQARHIIESKEVPQDMISSSSKVAVIMTQDWCPQWTFMKSWLDVMEEKGIKVFHISYNNKPYFHEFMTVKEGEFGNDLVPYVRYYLNGQYIKDSNFVSKELFLSNFHGDN